MHLVVFLGSQFQATDPQVCSQLPVLQKVIPPRFLSSGLFGILVP